MRDLRNPVPAGPDPFGLRARGINDPRVLRAMAHVDRQEFVAPALRSQAYDDGPLPIGWEQTISQPFIVAWMTEALDVAAGAAVLEIGTGSGYQTAILAELGARIWTIEVVPELAATARERLSRLGYTSVHFRTGTGYEGWPEAAPFDRIIVTAAPPEVPSPLVAQLGDQGRLIAPVGVDSQVIVILEKRGGRVERRESLPVRFVPMR